jgi:threonine synthase
MNNIILIGPPGAGKTSVGNALAELFPEKETIDVDDFLEVHWDCTVGEKLAEVGDENFIEEEGRALAYFDVQDSIIMMSGSNPLHTHSMNAIKKTGVCVYIDTPHEIILNRLAEMKVERIVGQSQKSLPEILKYRKKFYEDYHDLRVHVLEGECPKTIAKKVAKNLESNKKFVSTRGFVDEEFSFLDVVKEGLAPDGGLFVPQEIPSFLIGEISRLQNQSYAHRAKKILEKFALGGISPQKINDLVERSYEPFHHASVAPLKKLKKNEYILELFHGPTASFKDMALQLTPKFFTEANKSSGENPGKFCILAATSGDTGIAAIEGFKKEPNMKVVVLFPKGGVSKIQQAQMLSAEGENVKVLEVDGDFDFCQSTVKEIFSDQKLKKDLLEKSNTRLSAANSMNWGRLLPQVIYYFSAYADLLDKKVIKLGNEIDVTVPCGNFGNILGAYIAKEMGLPIRKFIAASNENNVLTQFITTGEYDLREKTLKLTNSPSIDILKSSNVERFLYFMSDGDAKLVKQCFEDLNTKKYFKIPENILEKIQKNFAAGFTTEEETGETIKTVLQETGELLDTHTAVAVKVAREFEEENIPMIIASTAYFAKFAPAILKYLGEDSDEKHPEKMFQSLENIAPRMEMHPDLRNIFSKPIIHTDTVTAEKDKVIQKIVEFIEK